MRGCWHAARHEKYVALCPLHKQLLDCKGCQAGFANGCREHCLPQVVDSAPLVGVTRVLKWVRLGEGLDLLDAPGVIPAAFNDQIAAQRLAMCNDIGDASYIDSLIAAAFIIRCRNLPAAPRILTDIRVRY